MCCDRKLEAILSISVSFSFRFCPSLNKLEANTKMLDTNKRNMRMSTTRGASFSHCHSSFAFAIAIALLTKLLALIISYDEKKTNHGKEVKMARRQSHNFIKHNFFLWAGERESEKGGQRQRQRCIKNRFLINWVKVRSLAFSFLSTEGMFIDRKARPN